MLRTGMAFPATNAGSIFDFTVRDIEGRDVDFGAEYRGTAMKAMLIVNVASN